MRPFIETGAMIAACGSAIFWFRSAICRLPSIKPSIDEAEAVTELSKALQRMNRSNFWAAGLMGITALLSASGRLLGHLLPQAISFEFSRAGHTGLFDQFLQGLRPVARDAWHNETELLRVAIRFKRHRKVQFDTLGFRVARTMRP